MKAGVSGAPASALSTNLRSSQWPVYRWLRVAAARSPKNAALIPPPRDPPLQAASRDRPRGWGGEKGEERVSKARSLRPPSGAGQVAGGRSPAPYLARVLGAAGSGGARAPPLTRRGERRAPAPGSRLSAGGRATAASCVNWIPASKRDPGVPVRRAPNRAGAYGLLPARRAPSAATPQPLCRARTPGPVEWDILRPCRALPKGWRTCLPSSRWSARECKASARPSSPGVRASRQKLTRAFHGSPFRFTPRPRPSSSFGGVQGLAINCCFLDGFSAKATFPAN